jgi:hypothetical protein
MSHHAHESAADGDWTLVSAKHPCSICGANDRCRRGFSDEFACCVRMASDWPLTTGGWVHRQDSPRSETRARVPASYASAHAPSASSAWDERVDGLSVAS